jgi:Zn-dependent protease with chaperone function
MLREMLTQFLSLPVHFGLACLLALFANWLGMRPWHRTHEAHWSERARHYWPAMVAARTNFFIIPIILDQAHRLLSPETFEWWIATDLAAFLGAMLGAYPMDKALYPRLGFATWLHRAFAGWISLLLPYSALVAAMIFMPDEFGWASVLVIALYLVLHGLIQFGLLMRVLRWMRLLTPANERLQKIVADQSAKSNTRVRATWLLESESAQAYALMTTGELLYTTGLMECCTDDEISAITAHELAHLSESRWIIAARLLTSLNYMPLIFFSPALHYLGGIGILLIVGLFILMLWLAPRLAHRMELRADCMATGQQLNEGDYARALLKLHQHNQLPAVNPKGQHTHPSLYDRLVAAGAPPDFPRPKPPAKATLIYRIYLAALVIIFLLQAFQNADPEMK